ncbi:unnamed protein product, partial [Diplocarpon coronariae]
GSFAFHSTLK